MSGGIRAHLTSCDSSIGNLRKLNNNLMIYNLKLRNLSKFKRHFGFVIIYSIL